MSDPPGADPGLTRLASAARAVTASLDPERVFSSVVEGARELLHGAVARLWVSEAEGGDLVLVATAVDPAERVNLDGSRTRFSPGESILAAVMRDGRPRYSAAVAEESLAAQRAWFVREGLRSQLAVPLLTGDAVLGALAVICRERREFSRAEQQVLEAFAAQAVIAIQNARHHRRTEERAAKLAPLSHVCQEISAAQEPERVFDAVAVAARTLLGAARADVWIEDAGGSGLRLAAHAGSGGAPRVADMLPIPRGEGLAGYVFATGEEIHVADVQRDPRMVNARRAGELGLHGFAGVPLVVEGGVVGVVTTLFWEVRTPDAEERELLRLVADHAAIAIRNARLLQGERDARSAAAVSEARYRELFDHAADVVYVHDLTGKLIAVNEAGLRATGWSRGEVEGRSAARFVAAASRRRFAGAIRAGLAMHPEPPRRFVAELACKDGRLLPVECRLRVVHRDGIPVAVEGVARDITARRRLEERHAAFREIVKQLATEDSFERLFALIGESACRLVGAHSAVVSLIEGDEIVLRGAYGAERPAAMPSRRKLAESRVARVVETCRPHTTADMAVDDHWRESMVVTQLGYRAALEVPIFMRDEPLGVLGILQLTPRVFSDDDVSLACALAEHTAIAIDRMRRIGEVQTLLDMTVAVTATVDPTEAMRRVARAVARAIGSDMAGAYLADATGETMRPIAGYRIPADLREALRDTPIRIARQPFFERAWLTCQAVFSIGPHEGSGLDQALVRRFPLESVLFVPMAVGARCIGGFFAAWSRQKHRFTPEEIRLVEAISRQAAVLLDNALLFEEVERRRREADVVADLARTINASLDADTVATGVITAARELCGSDTASIALRQSPGSDALDFRYHDGIRGRWDSVHVRPGRTAGGIVLATGRPFRTATYAADDRLGPDHKARMQAEELSAVLVVPIRIDARIEGLLYVGNRAERAFTDRDESVLGRLADQVAIAIKNSAMFAREQAARAAAEISERRFRELVQTLDAIVWESDVTLTRFSFVSQRAGAILGSPPARWTGEPGLWLASIHDEDRARVCRVAADAVAARTDYEVEYRMAPRDAPLVWLRDRVHVVVDASGSPVQLRGVSVDLTQGRVAEEQLRKLSRAVEHSPVSIVITDTTGAIEYVNPRFSEVSGYTLDEVLGRNPRMFQSGRTPPETYRTLWRTITAGAEWSGELLNRRKNGELYWEFLSVSPIRNADGAITHFVGIKDDLTERKRAEEALRSSEEQLRQTQKMEAVGRLAGGVAHDFNNLLTVISGRGHILAESLGPADPRRADLDLMLGSADRAAVLTRQLLAFSRRQVLKLRLVDVNAIVANIGSMLRRLIGEDIELSLGLAPAELHVRADAGQLEQVVLNLAVNARDAMPGGGRLVIETARVAVTATDAGAPVPAGRWVRLTIADTGCGMTEEVKAQAFEPFFTTKPSGKGTGLGLSTVYGIVKQSGGEITLDTAPGRGATVDVFLPAMDAPGTPVVREAGRGAVHRGAETVLLVEDERDVRVLARELLSRAGYTVLEAAHGTEAVDVWQREAGRIHLLLTDVVMPHVSGPELAERLRRERPSLKVLFMSGYAEDAAAQRGAFARDASLLEKPFSEESLTRAVRQVLDGAGNASSPDPSA